MKIVLYCVGGVIISAFALFVVLGFDSAHPSTTVKKQKYTVIFNVDKKVKEVWIMMALPVKRVERDSVSGVKKQLGKYKCFQEMKRIKGNTFSFYLPITSKKYHLWSDRIYDEFALAAILICEFDSAGFILNIKSGKYEYVIEKKSLKFKEIENIKKGVGDGKEV